MTKAELVERVAALEQACTEALQSLQTVAGKRQAILVLRAVLEPEAEVEEAESTE